MCDRNPLAGDTQLDYELTIGRNRSNIKRVSRRVTSDTAPTPMVSVALVIAVEDVLFSAKTGLSRTPRASKFVLQL